MTDIKKEIEDTIKKNPVVLFMKGNKQMPQCGFSAAVGWACSTITGSIFTTLMFWPQAICARG